MRFANANDNFKIIKTIVKSAMIKILIDFMQRQIKFHLVIIMINVFLLL